MTLNYVTCRYKNLTSTDQRVQRRNGGVIQRMSHQTITSFVAKEGRKCFIFNDALNTFYLRLYGVRHMVKDQSDSEIGNPLPPPHVLFLTIILYMHHSTDHGICYTNSGAPVIMRNSSMGPP